MSHASVEAFFEACRPPEPKRGEKVRILTYHNSAVRGVTHEVRQVPRPDQIDGFGLYWGSKKNCLSFIEIHGLVTE